MYIWIDFSWGISSATPEERRQSFYKRTHKTVFDQLSCLLDELFGKLSTGSAREGGFASRAALFKIT